jgi:geranylgeranyl pyrophosphate synthase
MEFEAYAGERRRRLEQTLERLLPTPAGPAGTLAAAMRYAVLGGGKRLRPLLVLAAHEACAGAGEPLEPAAAVELIHTYSLIHDDLPAMDDDDLRRGRPTVHRAFDEAVAVLAGDALLTLALEVLATRPAGASATCRAEAVACATRGAGFHGMVGGQMADLEAEGSSIDAESLRSIHRAKTGALFSASAEIGAIHAAAGEPAREALQQYGRALGLAFQIADDMLDRTATSRSLGKTPGKDLADGKATYPALFGMEGSRQEAGRLVALALAALDAQGLRTEPLVALAEQAITRSC